MLTSPTSPKLTVLAPVVQITMQRLLSTLGGLAVDIPDLQTLPLAQPSTPGVSVSMTVPGLTLGVFPTGSKPNLNHLTWVIL